ncbi:MAG: small basic protein [Fuerstiella sp.]
MTIDKSLKKPSGVIRLRNVLKRDERVKILMDQDRWVDGQSPMGLAKVRIAKAVAGKKKKKTAEE